MITYLYHKQHKQTGLNYFGKTTKDPQYYRGSGKYWLSHLKKHGNDVATLQVWKFTNINECSKFALEFSFKHNIVESNEWANLRLENGLDGGDTPSSYTESARQKRKEKLTGRVFSPETLIKMSLSKKGKKTGSENSMFGKRQSDLNKETAKIIFSQKAECMHCGMICRLANHTRWHGNNCKNKSP